MARKYSPKKKPMSPKAKSPKAAKSESKDNSQNAKYCRCVLHVSMQNKNRGTNYNPYAVCTARVGRVGRPKCGQLLNFDTMDEDELILYAKNNGLNPAKYKSLGTLRGALKRRKQKIVKSE